MAKTGVTRRGLLIAGGDRDYHARYFKVLRKYDVGTRSMTQFPPLDRDPCGALIEDRFPSPVLF